MKTTWRKLAMLFAVLLLSSPAAMACEVCVGNPDDPQTQGMQAAILTLLIITYLMLTTIIGFFVFRHMKHRKLMLVNNQIRSI